MIESKNTRYCDKCLHYDANAQSCPAFPNGIPDQLLAGKIKHILRFPEQVGKDVYVNSREYWEGMGLEFHPMEGIDDFIVED